MKHTKRAWAAKTDGFDGLGLVVAKTEAGARGFLRHAALEAGYEIKIEDFECEVVCLYALDEWAAVAEPGRCLGLEHGLQAVEYKRRDSLRGMLAFMRKDGNGLTKTQEDQISGAAWITLK